MPTEIFTNGEALQLNLPKDTKDVKSNVRVRAKKCSKSDRAGLKMSVGKIHKELKGSYSSRVGGTAAVYLAAVAEYLTAEILELAAHAAKENKKLRISPRHLLFAIRQDDEINRLLKKTNATENGPIPLKLVQKKTAKRTRRARVSSK